MESHSSRNPHQSVSPAVSPDSQKFNPHIEMSPSDQALLTLAEKKYAVYMGKAQEVDDAQEFFTSSAANLVIGSRLTTILSLRASRVTPSSN